MAHCLQVDMICWPTLHIKNEGPVFSLLKNLGQFATIALSWALLMYK